MGEELTYIGDQAGHFVVDHHEVSVEAGPGNSSFQIQIQGDPLRDVDDNSDTMKMTTNDHYGDEEER